VACNNRLLSGINLLLKGFLKMAINNILNNSLVGQSGDGAFAGTEQPAFLEPSADNFISGATVTATAAGTTTLLVSSTQTQIFTGVTTETIVLPVVTTFPQIGVEYLIINESTGTLTVNSSGSNLVATIPAGSWARVVCQLITGTTAASWVAQVSASPAAAFAWVPVAGTTQAAAVNTGYISNNAAQTTFTAPATAAVGDVIIVKGVGAGGWIMTANTGQTIRLGTAVTASAGTVTSANGNDSFKMTCIVANTTWSIDYAISTGLDLV